MASFCFSPVAAPSWWTPASTDVPTLSRPTTEQLWLAVKGDPSAAKAAVVAAVPEIAAELPPLLSASGTSSERPTKINVPEPIKSRYDIAAAVITSRKLKVSTTPRTLNRAERKLYSNAWF